MAPEPVAEPAVVVTGASRELRSSLGVFAWAVLEDVALDAVTDAAGCLVATTSVRRVAEHLGIGKDTAAAALARLAERGLVERRPAGRADGGRFGRSVYVIHLDAAAGVTHLGCHLPSHRSEPGATVHPAGDEGVAVQPAGDRLQPKPGRSRTRRTEGHEQASLFDSNQEPAR